MNHVVKDCFYTKKGPVPNRYANSVARLNANIVTGSVGDPKRVQVSSFIPKVYLTYESCVQWIHTYATVHICINISVFTSYQDPGGRSVTI